MPHLAAAGVVLGGAAMAAEEVTATTTTILTSPTMVVFSIVFGRGESDRPVYWPRSERGEAFVAETEGSVEAVNRFGQQFR